MHRCTKRGVFCSLGVDGSGSCVSLCVAQVTGQEMEAREEPQSDSGKLVAPRTSREMGDFLGQWEGNRVCEVVWVETTGFCLIPDDAEAALCCLVFPPRAEGAQHLSVISAVTWGKKKNPLDDTRVSLNPACPWALLQQKFPGQGRSFGLSSPNPFPPPLPSP